MLSGYTEDDYGNVALLAEGVDRNLMSVRVLLIRWSRPPRGGRG